MSDGRFDLQAETEQLSRADERRRDRDVVEEGAPREGVDIIRPVEKAVLVGVQLPGRTDADIEASLRELVRLLWTAGAEAVDYIVQRRDAPDPATYIGKGKADEVRDRVAATGADAAVFDDELSPAQQRNLEERIGQKVLDRTIVILDIFAQHASSREGQAQVELAQLRYLLPRLRGWGEALSRQEGRVGTRGPGESQLEVDRRRIMRRISKLEDDLEDFERVRRTKSRERERSRVRTAALVGYTNAGKSSLLNRLTGADALVRQRLFATLDATVRQLELDDGREVVVTDTVGFVRKLPHNLVEAFKSTLEESTRADLLLHVVDAAHPAAEAQIVAVREVLEEIGADEVPEQIVLNKVDVADRDEVARLERRIARETGGEAVAVSARTGEGIDELIERIGLRLPDERVTVTARVPYARQDMVALTHRRGEVHKKTHDEQGTELVATLDEDAARQLRPWLEDDPFAGDGREP